MPEDRLPGSRPAGRRRVAVVAVALLALGTLAVVAGATVGRYAPADSEVPGTAASPAANPPSSAARPSPSAAPGPTAVEGFDRTTRSIDDPTSLWVIVNKHRPLTPPDHTPADLVVVPVPHVFEPRLRQEASAAVVAMLVAITEETGLRLQSQSAYRGFEAQTRVYDRGVAAGGVSSADAAIARPGYSEHQTGLAIDLASLPAECSLNACFADTAQGRWLAQNSWRFGYVVRYPADKVAVTGYEFEPWHFRYVGVNLAGRMHFTGVTTLEEFFRLPAAPGYD